MRVSTDYIDASPLVYQGSSTVDRAVLPSYKGIDQGLPVTHPPCINSLFSFIDQSLHEFS